MAEENKIVDANQFAKLLHQVVSKAKKKKDKKDTVEEKNKNEEDVDIEEEDHECDSDCEHSDADDEVTDYHREKMLEILGELSESHRKMCDLFETLLDREF
jgi:hypothetical protein